MIYFWSEFFSRNTILCWSILCLQPLKVVYLVLLANSYSRIINKIAISSNFHSYFIVHGTEKQMTSSTVGLIAHLLRTSCTGNGPQKGYLFCDLWLRGCSD